MKNRETRRLAINSAIIRKLLESSDEFVSGSDLASALGISRVSIWGHLEKLREEGFEFEAIRNKGYRLAKEPKGVHLDLLEAYISLRGLKIGIFYKSETDSTMNEVERLISTGEKTPLVFIAGKQTAGRGRHQRSWKSESSDNLYISFGFKPDLEPKEMLKLTPLIAISICQLFHDKYSVPVKIKWPNDLILNDRKICGMLAESRIDMDHMRDLVFGIGLNVNDTLEGWSSDLLEIGTSLYKETGNLFRINKLATDLIETVLNAYKKTTISEDLSCFTQAWESYDYLLNKPVTGTVGSRSISGKVKGIDHNGKLKLLLPDGTLRLVSVGEFQLSK